MNNFLNTKHWLECGMPKLPTDKQILKTRLIEIREYLEEEIQEFFDAYENEDRDEMINAIIDAHVIIDNFAYFIGMTEEEFGLESALVTESNWTKYCKTEEEAKNTVDAYLNGTHPNKPGVVIETVYKHTGNPQYPYVILRVRDNKIQKSINYKEPYELKNSDIYEET